MLGRQITVAAGRWGRGTVLVAACGLAVTLAAEAQAGGGPESIFLVVNGRSWSSQTVANHYIGLRKIPSSNVLYLDWSGDNEAIDIETFRTKLLTPILAEIERRDVGDHIDYVVYSTDFPWAIDCAAETKGRQISQYLTPIASLNGLTYLYQDVMARNPEFLLLDANRYFRPFGPRQPPQSHGFRSWYGWGKDGTLLEAGGQRYLLSMMLGVATGRGMSTQDIVRNLTRSVGADFTKPTGTIYYARNDDVRSKTRQDLFFPAVDLLAALKVRAEVVNGVVPERKADVMGAMIGAEQFGWDKSGSRLRPGAIAEHLTSTGGVMYDGAAQTPLTSNLLAGAAAASGAVTEPFAIPQKFPNAFMHAHYARGCSLAEAFYQSINGPYQMLIVGDPLCRPWADPPRVRVAGVEVGATVKDVLTLTPSATLPAGAAVARFELYSDGQLYDECDGREQPSLSIDTRRLAEGYHELRVMAVAGEPIESRGGVLLPVTVSNQAGAVTLERIDDRPVRWGEPLRLRAKSPGAIAIVLAQGSRSLAQGRGEQAEFTFDPKILGLGPVSLQAAAVAGSGQSNRVSAPLEFEILSNEPLPSFQIPGGALFKPGMLLTQEQGEPRPVFATVPEKWLTELGITPNEVFSITGFFNVDRDCEFQFQLRHAMQVAVLVDDRPLYEAKNAERVTDYIPVALKAGLHKLEIRGRAGEDMRLDIRYGYAGMRVLRPSALTHIPLPQ
jgi:hypothetical protein